MNKLTNHTDDMLRWLITVTDVMLSDNNITSETCWNMSLKSILVFLKFITVLLLTRSFGKIASLLNGLMCKTKNNISKKKIGKHAGQLTVFL